MRLLVGGGQQKVKDFINVDLCDGADIKHDLRNPLPFEDKSVDEMMAIHVIESFNQWEFPDVLKDWNRVLKGKLTIEFTDLRITADMYLNGEGERKKWGHWGLYGNQEEPVDPIVLHHYVYEKEELEDLLKKAGFKNIIFTKENVQHVPERDWRVICNND